MAARKPFLLRVEPGVLTALERWAADDLRSVNGQIEYLLRDALRRAGRKVATSDEQANPVDSARPAASREAEHADDAPAPEPPAGGPGDPTDAPTIATSTPRASRRR